MIKKSEGSELMPELLEPVPPRARHRHTVAAALVGHAWIQDIVGALTIPVLMQYLHLGQQLEHISLSPGSQIGSFGSAWHQANIRRAQPMRQCSLANLCCSERRNSERSRHQMSSDSSSGWRCRIAAEVLSA
jgi:hypothetical protein